MTLPDRWAGQHQFWGNLVVNLAVGIPLLTLGLLLGAWANLHSVALALIAVGIEAAVIVGIAIHARRTRGSIGRQGTEDSSNKTRKERPVVIEAKDGAAETLIRRSSAESLLAGIDVPFGRRVAIVDKEVVQHWLDPRVYTPGDIKSRMHSSGIVAVAAHAYDCASAVQMRREIPALVSQDGWELVAALECDLRLKLPDDASKLAQAAALRALFDTFAPGAPDLGASAVWRRLKSPCVDVFTAAVKNQRASEFDPTPKALLTAVVDSLTIPDGMESVAIDLIALTLDAPNKRALEARALAELLRRRHDELGLDRLRSEAEIEEAKRVIQHELRLSDIARAAEATKNSAVMVEAERMEWLRARASGLASPSERGEFDRMLAEELCRESRSAAEASRRSALLEIDRLTRISPPYSVEIWAASEPVQEVAIRSNYSIREVRIGHFLRLQVRAPIDGYLSVWNVGTSGELVLLYPNPLHPDGAVSKGRIIDVPGVDDNFDLPIEGPSGREIVEAIVTPAPLPVVLTEIKREQDRLQQTRLATRVQLSPVPVSSFPSWSTGVSTVQSPEDDEREGRTWSGEAVPRTVRVVQKQVLDLRRPWGRGAIGFEIT